MIVNLTKGCKPYLSVVSLPPCSSNKTRVVIPASFAYHSQQEQTRKA